MLFILTYNVRAMASQLKLHFSPHAMAMLIIRSWIVHLTLIPGPCSTFALTQLDFHTMCTQWVSLMASLRQDKLICPPTFKSPFSFHSECSQVHTKPKTSTFHKLYVAVASPEQNTTIMYTGCLWNSTSVSTKDILHV